MKRKAIQLARKTLVVSLPSKWTKKLGIEKGDELEVDEKENKLTISASKKLELEKTTINLEKTKNPSLIRWTVSAVQKSGYDEIEILYENQEAVKIVHDMVRNLFVGFAVTEQSKNRCVIRSIAKEVETEFDSMLRRAFLVTINMGESIVEYLRMNRHDELADLKALEQTNNQLTNFCERLLIKKGYKEFRKTCFAYVIVWDLEKVCDAYKHIINDVEGKRKISEETISLLEKANQILKKYYEIYYKFEHDKLSEAVDEIRKIEERGNSMLTKGQDQVITSKILNMTELISNFSASIIAINS